MPELGRKANLCARFIQPHEDISGVKREIGHHYDFSGESDVPGGAREPLSESVAPGKWWLHAPQPVNHDPAVPQASRRPGRGFILIRDAEPGAGAEPLRSPWCGKNVTTTSFKRANVAAIQTRRLSG